MRNGQNNKRMRGRNHHHHRKNQNPLTRVYESNGPEVKIRGTASHVAEKYMQLARDATSSGDPVTAENHFQHAEHYFRLIAVAQEQFRQQNPYYRPEGEMRDENSDDAFDDSDDSLQPMQGQPNFGDSQPPYPPRDSQPSYPPREPQHQGGQNHQPNNQHGRPQHQQHHRPQHQQHNQPPQQHNQQPNLQNQPPNNYQPQNQPQNQPTGNDGNDVERLPSFITGGAGGQPQQNGNQNGYDNNQGGDRYGRHRRRRHRGGNNRPDMQGGQGMGDSPDSQRPDGD